jgi:hypothetical protein
MQAEIKTVVPPKVQRGFEITRRKLVETLSKLTFMRVTMVTFPPSALRTGTHFQGEAEEVFPGKFQQRKGRTAFFSRYARSQGLNILGTFQVIDAPIGLNHSSAIPQIGDILVGSITETKKGKIPYELRGWSNNAQPLLELYRISQYGTRMSEKELIGLLKQPGSAAAKIFLRLNRNLSQSEKQLAEKAVQAQDDLWCLARIVCFGRLEEDKTLNTSKGFVEIVDNLAMKYGDEELLDEWTKVRPEQYDPETSYVHQQQQSMYMQQQQPVYQQPMLNMFQNYSQPQISQPANVNWNTSGNWNPKDVIQQARLALTEATTQEFAPTSPKYAPTSPVYNPTSPKIQPTTPPYYPTSPTYNPSSPKIIPSSPPYNPSSPRKVPSSPPFIPSSATNPPSSPKKVPSSPPYNPSSPIYNPTSSKMSVENSISSKAPAEPVRKTKRKLEMQSFEEI